MAWKELGTSEFLAFDSTLDLGQARLLADKVSPKFLVIRAADKEVVGEFPAAPSEYFVVDTIDLFASNAVKPEWKTIGDFVRDRLSAVVVDTDDGWMRKFGGFDFDPAKKFDAVVLGEDGIVSKVVPDLKAAFVEQMFGQGAADDPAPSRHLHHAMENDNLTAMGVTAILGPDAGAREVFGGDGGGGDGGGGGGGGGGEPPDGVPPEDGDDLGPMALEVQLADAVKLGDTTPLLVLLEPGPGGPGSAPLSVKANEVLEIVASPTSGFTLVDKPSKPMSVLRDGQTLPVKFDLRADVVGKGAAKVYAFRDGTCVASVTVSAEIGLTAPAPGSGVPTKVPLPAAVKAIVDLDLIVLKESYQGGIALSYRLTDRDNVVSTFGPHQLDSDPSGYVHAKFAEIQALSQKPGPWDNARRTRMGRIGSDLYESLIPPDLQDVLWNTDRVRSLLVQTEEPWIPWELCRMTIRRPGGSTEARGFLCDLYEMSRWLPGIPFKTDLRATSVAIVAPRDSNLPSSPLEVKMLEGLAAAGPKVKRIKATYESVIAALESHRYDVVHFVGHGQNVDRDDVSRSEFILAGQWRLTPSDISGETKNLGLASPVVFMNACEVAQAAMGLHGVGGWAAAMTKAGAGAFIGTHWDVRDDLAREFAATFYEKLMAPPSITVAAAALAARQAVQKRSDGDATWLAYSVHASPGAACAFSAPAA